MAAQHGQSAPLSSAPARPSTPPVPPQRAPGGSGQLGTPRARLAHWARPATASGARVSCLQRRRFTAFGHAGWAPRPRVSLSDAAQASFQRVGRVAGIMQGFVGRFTLRWPAAHNPRREWRRMLKVKPWWCHSSPHRPPLWAVNVGSSQACSPHLGGRQAPRQLALRGCTAAARPRQSRLLCTLNTQVAPPALRP